MDGHWRVSTSRWWEGQAIRSNTAADGGAEKEHRLSILPTAPAYAPTGERARRMELGVSGLEPEANEYSQRVRRGILARRDQTAQRHHDLRRPFLTHFLPIQPNVAEE